MGKGGPLAFLAKKPWHPARFSNQEEVWKREAAAAAEAKKAEELRKQLEEERKKNEFIQMAEDAGHLRRGDRLDWMYQGGMAAKEDAAKRAEEHLMGKAASLAAGGVIPQEMSKCEQTSALPSFMTNATPASQNEAWARLNNDPLLMIKKRQADQLKSIRDNPIKMQQIIQEVQAGKHKDKKKKKEKKKSKKEKKSKRERISSSSSSDSEGELQKHSVRHHLQGSGGGARSSDIRHDREQVPLKYSKHEEDHADGRGHQQHRPSSPDNVHHRERDDRGYDRQPYGGSRSGREDRSKVDDERDQRQQGSDHYLGNRTGSLRDGDQDHDQRGIGERRGRGPSNHDDDHHPEGKRRHQSHDFQQDREHRGTTAKDNGRRQQEGDRGEGSKEESRGAHSHEVARKDEAAHDDHAERASCAYGLSHCQAAPEQLRGGGSNLHKQAEQTRSRLEEAARLKHEEERNSKAAQKYQKKEYRTGQLTEEEHQKRLAEMMSNANEHDQHRQERLKKAKEADSATDGRIVENVGGVGGRDGDAFAKAASRDVYGALSSSMGSLEARVSSRKHFNSR
ncbi:hypothetical protein CEUSTIGMA_g11219.t1 [Chlamydomonas eustigma]|uniref:CBF1-interacting co-repressor CIR N-terminal domain-containing protein n=1 Tax=Chlamydomonas eustigma TaxID=1157962 RepID=A0A250XL45_9CHLO|nr:hypothetical protein CEUSTIGMA_g11219.t1 [Chlamydomonas eustigma]|eukprot:GAX83794.1 hypothetical protein CEUSTIGMA_g11219.t1 [Chlamydomonas eustigma]